MKTEKFKFKILEPVSWFANGISVLLFLMLIFIPLIQNNIDNYRMPVFIFLNLVVHTWFYKVKKMKNSKFVNKEWVEVCRDITLSELDSYTNLRFWQKSIIKLLVGCLLLNGMDFPTTLEIVVVMWFIMFLIDFYLSWVKGVKFPSGDSIS